MKRVCEHSRRIGDIAEPFFGRDIVTRNMPNIWIIDFTVWEGPVRKLDNSQVVCFGVFDCFGNGVRRALHYIIEKQVFALSRRHCNFLPEALLVE